MGSLGRKDRVTAVLTVFYLHLALYFWRAGYSSRSRRRLSRATWRARKVAVEETVRASDRTLAGSPFRGKLLLPRRLGAAANDHGSRSACAQSSRRSTTGG